MANINFQGNVGKIQGLKFGQDGKPRFQLSVAEGHRGKVNGEWADTGTTWYSVTLFGYQAEDLDEVLEQGGKQRVVVSGRLSSREYEVNGEKRSSLDVVADHVGVVPRKAQGRSQQAQGSPWSAPEASSGTSDGWGDSNPAQGQSEAPF